MTVRHNYLVGTGTKPTAAETEMHEIVINEADGAIWTKNAAGTVIKLADSAAPPDLSLYETIVNSDANDATTLASAKTYTDTEIGAIPPTDVTGKADITYVDSENATQDTAIAGKEDSITYGAVDYMAIVNATTDGFDFIAQPDFEFYRLRGTIIPHAGSIPNAFADTVGDNAVAELVAGLAPAVGSDPSGVTYRCETAISNVIIHPGEGAVNIATGDLIFWSGDSSKWLHIPVEDAGGVTSVNNLEGLITIDATDGITVTTDTAIHLAVDTSVSRTGHTHVALDITDLQAKLDAKAEVVHTHVMADVTDLAAEFATKAELVHTHVEADITNLDKYTKAEVDAMVIGGALTGEPV